MEKMRMVDPRKKKKSRHQKALDAYNDRQGELDPRYKSRLAEEKRKANQTVNKARARPKPPKAKKKVVAKKKVAKKKVNR